MVFMKIVVRLDGDFDRQRRVLDEYIVTVIIVDFLCVIRVVWCIVVISIDLSVGVVIFRY